MLECEHRNMARKTREQGGKSTQEGGESIKHTHATHKITEIINQGTENGLDETDVTKTHIIGWKMNQRL